MRNFLVKLTNGCLLHWKRNLLLDVALRETSQPHVGIAYLATFNDLKCFQQSYSEEQMRHFK